MSEQKFNTQSSESFRNVHQLANNPKSTEEFQTLEKAEMAICSPPTAQGKLQDEINLRVTQEKNQKDALGRQLYQDEQNLQDDQEDKRIIEELNQRIIDNECLIQNQLSNAIAKIKELEEIEDNTNQYKKEIEEQIQKLEIGFKKQIEQLTEQIQQQKAELQQFKEQSSFILKRKDKNLLQLQNQLKEQYQLIKKLKAEKETKQSENDKLISLIRQYDNKILKKLSISKQEDNQISQKLLAEQKLIFLNIEKNYQMNLIRFNQLTEEKQEQLDQSQNQIEQLKQIIQQMREDLNVNQEITLIYDQNIIKKMEQNMQLMKKIQEMQKEQQQKNQELNIMSNTFNNIKNLSTDLEKTLHKVKEKQQQISQIIEELKIRVIQDQIITVGDQKVKIQQQEIVSLIDRSYEKITECTKKESNWHSAIAFNKEQTIMIAGSCDKITVFEFKQGYLNQKQSLSDHNNDIFTLYFMKKFNQFISGAKCEIGIWSYNNTNQQYYCQQMLKQAHQDEVMRVIMNRNEDLIISCSIDKTIKFWIKKNEWECLQTLTNHSKQIFDICLNQSCTQLVSCDNDGQILISQQGDDQKWKKMQRIQSTQGYRICYINDNLIAFQPENGQNMETYYLNEQKKQFMKYKDIPVLNDRGCNGLFPMQFNNKKQLLLNKNGFRINLIRYKNNDLIIQQSINFGTEDIWGAMTDDFEYLVIWDGKCSEFQVWQQQ